MKKYTKRQEYSVLESSAVQLWQIFVRYFVTFIIHSFQYQIHKKDLKYLYQHRYYIQRVVDSTVTRFFYIFFFFKSSFIKKRKYSRHQSKYLFYRENVTVAFHQITTVRSNAPLKRILYMYHNIQCKV